MGAIFRFYLFAGSAALFSAAAQAEPVSAGSNAVILRPAELFVFADRACDSRDYAAAEKAYRALTSNPDIELRSEARFRLGLMLADRLGKHGEAAIEFRKILDEKPHAARVRLELARMHALLGNVDEAKREFRAAEAAGLPSEVQQVVRFYANALNSRKSFGGSLEVALAPDNNINRATRSNSLGTVIGDFTLDDDAKARSGLGLSLRSQMYGRMSVNSRVQLLARVSGNGVLYRDADFNDVSLSLHAGPEFTLGSDRLALSLGPGWRWYGMSPYSFRLEANASWQHPMGKRAQLRLDGTLARINNRRNRLQDSTNYSLALALDRAFTSGSGGGIQLYGSRDVARDPGYATSAFGVTAYGFREIARTTAVATISFSHLDADQRLFLFLKRRADDLISASVAGTFRSLSVGAFAPLVRLRWEQNKSTVELYAFERVSAEFGITSAF